MNPRRDKRFDSDTTPSREVARQYREAFYDDDRVVSLALLHFRGAEEEFLLGKEYSLSNDAGDRATGAGILAQLGWSDQTFRDESIEILMGLLDDSDLDVVACAANALGHRSAQTAIPRLLEHAGHQSPRVRYAVVFGLLRHEDPAAIKALIKFAADDDRDVRNWAVYGLGSEVDADSQEIREALRRALNDPDHEIRGEALVGLATRGDPEIVAELLNEWKNDDISLLSLEAAEASRDPRLYDPLNHLTEILTLDHHPDFASKLADAIEACKPGITNRTT